MDNSITPLDYYPQFPSYMTQLRDEPTDTTMRFSLPIEDNELYTLIQQKRDLYEKNKELLKIDPRRTRNRDYWRGKHYDETTGIPPDDYRSDYMDPIIYENSETRFTLASQRMPDIICYGQNDDNKSVENAQIVEKFLRKKVNNKVTQRMIKDGLRQHEINYIAAIKPLWDPQLENGNGDFKYVLVNPARLIIDPNSTIPHDGYTADNMEFVGEILEEPVEKVYSKFPGKAEDLRRLLETAAQNGIPVPSKIKYEEWWLRYYKSGQMYESVCWLYQTLVLGKQKNPYYDWDGYKVHTPKLDADGNFKLTTTLNSETRYYNHFEIPRKPYIFFSYQNLGDGPFDDTTAIEQAIPTQKLVNRVGRQITEISDHAVPKKVFGNSITKEDARRVSSDPSESIWLDIADVSNAMNWIQAEPPSPELLALMQDARQRMDGIFNTHGAVKGANSATNESGIAKQITREGDLTVSDDLVDIVVERVVFEMAGWAMQLAKLFYDEPHFLRTTGSAGSVIAKELTKKDFHDGLEVDVKANSVDDMTNRADALNLASRKAIDPLTMFEDLDKPNPQERVRRLMAFINGPQDGYATYMKEIGVELEATSNPQPPFTVGGDQTESQDDAKQDIQSMAEGQIIAPPDKFDSKYVAAFIQFVRSGQFRALPKDVQQNFKEFIQQLSQNFQNFNVNTPGSAFTQGAPVGTPAMAGVPPVAPPLAGGV